ncbi:MAG: heavy metal translocating P-type ATPase metal-binding domain-containing protein [Lysobacterales bacterium]
MAFARPHAQGQLAAQLRPAVETSAPPIARNLKTVTALSVCHHCGEPLPQYPVQAEFGGSARAFCCDGCAAAARLD